MNTRSILAIIKKDLKVVSRNKGVMLPIIIAPLVMFVVLPLIVPFVPKLLDSFGLSPNSIDALITRLPAGVQRELSGLNTDQSLIVYALVYVMASLFLILPLMVASTIAADSFAGEKERKTLEALLYTPTTDRELFIAKLLSGWLAALVVALVGFVVYAVVANVAAWSQVHRILIPNGMWLVLIFWVVPALPGLGLGVMVLVSARAQGFQDAYQIGNLVVLPIVFLLFGQVSGLTAFSVTMAFLIGLVIWLLDELLIWFGSRSFRRSRLLGV
jgi:ABC-2 type transport system permease protein